MRTSLPIATISFNSPEFLKLKLEELRKNRIIEKWYFIVHEPEDDEGGKKRHIHLYLEPAKRVQTEDLREEFREFDPQKPEKPLGVLTFNNSKFAPWYLYALHDRTYLASKGQSRKFHYSDKQIQAFDEDELTFDIRSIDVTAELGSFKGMSDALDRGLTFTEYFASGRVPIQQVRAFEEAWNLLTSNRTNRAGRSGHDMEIDPETGEIKDQEIPGKN